MLQPLKKTAGYLAQLEIGLVAFFVLLSMIKPELLALTVVCAACFWVVRWLATGAATVHTAIDVPILLIILAVSVSLMVSSAKPVAVEQSLRLFSGIAIFYAIVNWPATRKNINTMQRAVFLALIGLGTISVFLADWSAGGNTSISAAQLFPAIQRFVGQVHPNVLAGCLVLSFPVLLAYLLFCWPDMARAERAGFILLSGFTLAVLLLTQSRGAWMALAASFLVLICLRWRTGWIAAVVLILSVLLVSMLEPKLVTEALASSTATGGMAGRMAIWSRAIWMMQDYPLTGIGFGEFNPVLNAFYPLGSTESSASHAHNLFLQVGVDLGLMGLIGWVAALILSGLTAWKVFRRAARTNDRWLAGLAAGLLASQIAVASHGLTDSVIWGMVRTAPLLWAIWGLIAAAGRWQATARE